MMARKKKSKKVVEKVVEKVEEIEAGLTDVGIVLPIIADENNPVSDGREFKDGEENE